MGADLCGQFMVVPELEWRVLLEARMNDLEAIMKAKLTDTEKLADLSELDVDHAYLADSFGSDSDDEVLQRIAEMIDLARTFDLDQGYRDQTSLGLSVNGKRIHILFAGEMSWGDSPDGDGYKMLEALNYLGIWTLFHDALDWGTPPPPRQSELDTNDGPSELDTNDGPSDDPQESK